MTGFSADPQFIQCQPLTHDVWFLKSKDWRTKNPHFEALKTRLHKLDVFSLPGCFPCQY